MRTILWPISFSSLSYISVKIDIFRPQISHKRLNIFSHTLFASIDVPYSKKFLDKLERYIMNYKNWGLSNLPKLKAEADNTGTRHEVWLFIILCENRIQINDRFMTHFLKIICKRGHFSLSLQTFENTTWTETLKLSTLWSWPEKRNIRSRYWAIMKYRTIFYIDGLLSNNQIFHCIYSTW